MCDADKKQTSNWYLVFTKIRSELKAQENLNRQGYVTYLPMSQKKRRVNGKNVISTEAFFSRYLFIYLNQVSDNWGPIRSTLGVSCIVCFGWAPAVVPNALVESLKLNEDHDGLQPTSDRKLSQGDKVVIVDGPFAGQYGTFNYLKGSERVAVLLDIVGKNTQVTLGVNDLLVV